MLNTNNLFEKNNENSLEFKSNSSCRAILNKVKMKPMLYYWFSTKGRKMQNYNLTYSFKYLNFIIMVTSLIYTILLQYWKMKKNPHSDLDNL
jgi:hypothetical protein